jgi:hypothetical protein
MVFRITTIIKLCSTQKRKRKRKSRIVTIGQLDPII